jgi:hypothetical protein
MTQEKTPKPEKDRPSEKFPRKDAPKKPERNRSRRGSPRFADAKTSKFDRA